MPMSFDLMNVDQVELKKIFFSIYEKATLNKKRYSSHFLPQSFFILKMSQIQTSLPYGDSDKVFMSQFFQLKQISQQMEEVESYELTLFIKQLKLSVKFPCRLTLQQAGKAIAPEIESNGTNVFSVNRQVNVKEEKAKDYLQININLATIKGTNIMAGIIKINLKDIASSEGQNLTISLQKCLDPYATCFLTVKSVKLNRSRIRRGTVVDDKRQRYTNDNNKFQTKSEAMVLDASKTFKQKLKFNEAESYIQKRANITPAVSSGLKQKALSMVGFKGVNSLFQKELASKFKHLNKRDDDQSKTMVVTGNRRQTDQIIKNSIEANEKSLKLQIIKYKTKFEQCERNLQQKTKQVKNLKDQISELNRQLTQKQYLIEEINSKNHQIVKLEQTNKNLSRQINQERTKIIELQRYIEEEKNSNFLQISRYKEDNQKKEYDFQKSLYQKKQELKEIMEENQYKVNQINKMKALIQDLQKSLDIKTYEFEKKYNQEKNEHNKIKSYYQQKNAQLSTQIRKLQTTNQEIILQMKRSEDQVSKLNKKIEYLQAELLQSQVKCNELSSFRLELQEEKRNLKQIQDQLNSKIKNLQKEMTQKERQIEDANNQLNENSATNKKKINQLIQKNKTYTVKIQELENKSNILVAQEQKIKRSLDMTQKQLKSLQQSQKNMSKTLKIKEDRILQLEKDITDIQGKNSLKDSLAKKDSQYKGIQLQKLTQRVSQLQQSYQKQRQIAEERRLQLLKAENRIKILEQNSNRLNQQIKDIKIQQIKKEDDWSETIKELKEDLKSMENRQAESNKALHSNEIQKLNLRNQISKLQKIVEAQSQKNEKLKRKQNQLQNFIKTLQIDIEDKNQNIVGLELSLKQLENEYKTLQADKSKTQKISSIINEEKDVAKSDISKLKKEIQKRQQKEDQYINQIKNLKQDITRWELKFNSLTKEYQKFKTNMSESIKNSLSVKNSYSMIETTSNSSEYSRSLSKPKYKPSTEYSIIENGDYKFGEVIQSIVKQSQQIIFHLNDQLKKAKRQKDLLQKQINALSMRSKQTQEELSRQLKQVNTQIEQLSVKHSTEIEDYEEKIFNFQREVKKKQRSLEDLSEQYNQLKQVYQNYQASSSINQSQLVAKINSLKNKIIDWQRKDEGITQTFVNLQEKITVLEAENTELTHQIEVVSQHLSKKQKQYIQSLDVIQELTHQLEVIKRSKSDLSAQVLTLKQSLIVQKESNKQLLTQIKAEEEKCNNLKKFNNDILKEKETYIKREAERQQKIYNLQEKIQSYLIQISQKTEEITQKEKLIIQCRDSLKVTQNQTNILSATLIDLKLSLQRERQKLKERQRRISQKQNQIQTLSSVLKKNQVKYEIQISQLTEQNETLATQIKNLKDQSSQKQSDLQHQLKKLTENQRKLNEANISLEQQIFFEKQMNSLNHSQLQDYRMQNLQLSTEIDNLKNEIINLNEEIRQKEESLFAFSGKLYASDNRLQSKEEQFKARIQKVELEWRYKIEQICQEYENKIEIIEKQKSYVNTGMQGYSENIQKLQNEKKILLNEIQREKEAYQLKLKRMQEEKVVSLVEKNKQIQKLRQVFQQLEEKLKRRDFEYKSLEEDKKKVEEKLRDLRAEIEKSEDKKGQIIRNLQKDIDQLKRKEGQLKRFKDALKNNQWATDRQIKKTIQSCAKGVATLTDEQNKEEVMNLMRNLETSITKIALPNIDEL